MLSGKIIKNISNTYQVLSGESKYDCKPRGKFRNMGLTPLVGDEVEFDEENLYILNILPRKNELERPVVSNIDIALIVASLKKPELSLNLLDKELSSIILADIEPVICFTKLDLLNSDELKEFEIIRDYYKSIGLKVFTNEEIPNLKTFLNNKYVVLTGQTGAGKSSLINLIDPDKHIAVGEISEALGRGKHTTRHTEFHQIDNFYLADTPGFSSLDLNKYSKEEIRDSFPEFITDNCEYRDCMHIKENKCAIKEQVESKKILKSRYDNYCNFISR